jgi:CBS domain-containing protein
MTAGEVCTKDVIVATRDESIVAAARRMREHHVGDLVVVEEPVGRRMPVGVLTDRDIVLNVVARGVDEVERAHVVDAMSGDLVWAHRDDAIEDVLARMTASGVRRIPLVDNDGCLWGVLALDDVMSLLSEELADVVRLVTRARKREQFHVDSRGEP